MNVAENLKKYALLPCIISQGVSVSFTEDCGQQSEVQRLVYFLNTAMHHGDKL